MPVKNPKKGGSVAIHLHGEVIRAIRQHARTSMTAEICGILIGTFQEGSPATITASIAGANAAQGGTHVTFTQDTWEHIYSVKDRDYPDDKILGWYHSHPGFGVFLSEHDTFIHRNFFSAKHQVAWVFDPHSDEEGCFGWNGDRIERLRDFAVIDGRGGEVAGEHREEPVLIGKEAKAETKPDPTAARSADPGPPESDSLEKFTMKFLALLLALAIGFAAAFFLFPKVVIMPVPVDPKTGAVLPEFLQQFAAHAGKGGGANAGK